MFVGFPGRNGWPSTCPGPGRQARSGRVHRGQTPHYYYSKAHMSSHFRRGFTLLELLVVIVIIGLLAGYVAPRYFAQEGKSKIQVTRAQIDSFEKALDTYRLDTGPLSHHRAGAGGAEHAPQRRAQVERPLPAQGRAQRSLGPAVYLSTAWRARGIRSTLAGQGRPAGRHRRGWRYLQQLTCRSARQAGSQAAANGQRAGLLLRSAGPHVPAASPRLRARTRLALTAGAGLRMLAWSMLHISF